MSSAVAHSWDYYEQEEEDLEAAQLPHSWETGQLEEIESQEEYVSAYAPLALYSTPFKRSSQAEAQAEALYSYSYAYHDTLPSRRRATRFAPLDAALGWLALMPGRIVLAGVVGLAIAIFGISNMASLMNQGTASSKDIYSFGSSASVAATNNKSNQATSSNAGRYLISNPTITPAGIDVVLRQYNSPAAGSGQAFYDLGVRYGINPAYALAFFIHESSAGTQGVAAATKSIGNIRCTAGYDCYGTQGNGSFRRYASWEAGAEDWYKLIKDLYIDKWNLKTLEQIIPVYAPSADRNNPAQYIQQVARLVDSWQK